MAAAVFEALEAGPLSWRSLDIRVLPGITAMLAASARAGAPLGHDFCAINLSDNLKPWALIEKRLRLAAQADFAMAFYNPRSKARPEGLPARSPSCARPVATAARSCLPAPSARRRKPCAWFPSIRPGPRWPTCARWSSSGRARPA
jgi:precorrin-3B C17-methyltransferase